MAMDVGSYASLALVPVGAGMMAAPLLTHYQLEAKRKGFSPREGLRKVMLLKRPGFALRRGSDGESATNDRMGVERETYKAGLRPAMGVSRRF